MRCKIPEISWHNRDPVLSVDFQANGKGLVSPTICRLASGGTDAHVLIWYVNSSNGGESVELELAADLARHQRAVNTVRWSPNGKLLASGDDESVVFIWKQKGNNEVINIVDAEITNEQDKEVYVTLKVLRGHREDIYDLSWSPNSEFLVTGSVDNTAMIWNVYKGKSQAILDDHKGYVQGVAWDPCNQFIATMSTDRHLRIFDVNTRKVLHRVSKACLPVQKDNELFGKNVRLFHDGTLQTFFRRLCFSPDGKLLITPAGITDFDGVLTPVNTTYGFSRYDLSQPAYVLPFPKEYTVAVRCSPVLYRLRPHDAKKNPPIILLPYRMVYAVATKNSVYFYDTQQAVPFAIISNMHYTRLTDVTWSSNGRILIVSSTDGFCSLLTFGEDELGERYEEMDTVLCAVAETSESNLQMIRKSKKKSRKLSTDEVATPRPIDEKLQNRIPIERKFSESGLTDLRGSVETDLDTDNDSSLHSGSSTTSSSPKLVFKVDVVPTPIAIRHSPRKVSELNQNDTKKAPTPIAIRRLPRKTSEAMPLVVSNKEATPIAIKRKTSSEMEPTQPRSNLLTENALPKPIEVIMTKEIISSEEKFESPEKKCRPATPIQVRRQPRTPSSNTPTQNTPTQKAQPAKQAMPIAVRRTPRVLIETQVNAPVVVEEAMDAWPLEEGITPISPSATVNAVPPLKLALNEGTCDHTEDIRLVYEDTQDNSRLAETAETTEPAPVVNSPKPSTANERTPRRVSLRTISTPKSKKKLLESNNSSTIESQR